jgi:TusA-related sulfurtransferase
VAELDLRGKVCPDPTAEVYTALGRLPADETLAVFSDYPPARQTIPAIARQFHRPCEVRDTADGTFTIVIQQPAPAGAA